MRGRDGLARRAARRVGQGRSLTAALALVLVVATRPGAGGEPGDEPGRAAAGSTTAGDTTAGRTSDAPRVVRPSASAAPGDVVWHVDAAGRIHSGFAPDGTTGDVCPLARVTIGPRTHRLAADGHLHPDDDAERYPMAARVTVEPTPYGRLELRPDSVALVDTASGDTLWRHPYATALAQRFGGPLRDLGSILHVPAGGFLVFWHCELAGMATPPDGVITVDIATGTVRRVRLIGRLGHGCVADGDAFVAILGHDPHSDQCSLVCYDGAGTRRWWRTVDAGTVTASGDGGGRRALLVVHALADGGGCRVTVLDGADGTPLLAHTMHGVEGCLAAVDGAADHLVCAGVSTGGDAARVHLEITRDSTGTVATRDLAPVAGPRSAQVVRLRVAALAAARRSGHTALVVTWTDRSAAGGSAGSVDVRREHVELWLLDAAGDRVARSPVPGSTPGFAPRRLEFVDDDRYLVAEQPARTTLFKARND